ncbi:hypothetical protein [Streptomyces wuyuanensis]|uniref:hypothetical protein n=1 Tax=Streptomyces wuyuanensis TaxID=1196353 RepID=UPI003439D08E
MDADRLVQGLRQYQRLGAGPAPADFAQALLRIRRDAAGIRAAEAVAAREGRRIAAWIASDGAAPALLRRVGEPCARHGHWWQGDGLRQVVLGTRERPVIQREFPAAFHGLGRPRGASCCAYRWPARDARWIAGCRRTRDAGRLAAARTDGLPPAKCGAARRGWRRRRPRR